MISDLLIVGQGLAGTLLAWEFERAGIAFQIADAGHADGATRVAAGIINPITGQRLVKCWRVDSLLPVARESYLAFGKELGIPLWQEMRVRRLFVNDQERSVLAQKQSRGELNDYAGTSDGEGFWIEGAARVDVHAMITAARSRWLKAGVLQEERVDFDRVQRHFNLVIDCTGDGRGPFGFVPWQFAKGECLTVAMEGLEPGVIVNRGQWLVPLGAGRAKVGATHAPGRRDRLVTRAAKAGLEAELRKMSAQPFTVTEQQAGVRVYVGDRKPVTGRHPAEGRLGVMNGLGGKGTLFAPALARQWVNHLMDGVPFDPELDVARLWRRSPDPASILSH